MTPKGFTLEKVVPWGRQHEEYAAMFALTEADLQRSILGCGDGPAAFNAVWTGRGGRVVSVDPIYRFSADDIRIRIRETYDIVMDQTRQNRHGFVWTHIRSLTELGRGRMAAMETFLADFLPGLAQGRYRDGQLPELAFADGEFDLALCSHLLFLYSAQLSEAFHLRSIKELRRVAAEVRVFPLLELGSRPSRHLQPIVDQLTADGYHVSLTPVAYEFQRGGNQMMVIQ